MLTFEARPQVRDKNLCSFVQSNSSVFEAVSVVKTRKVVDQEIHENSSRGVGFFN